MKALGKLLFVVVSMLFGSFLTAWLLSKLWLWFVAAQYGHGPALGTWYGLSLIGRLALYKPETATKENERDFEALATATVSIWAGELMLLGIAWCVGAALGWLP